MQQGRSQPSLGHTLLWPFCSPILLHAGGIFSYFSPARGEKKARRQLLVQGMLAAGATLAPWGLESCRDGDTVCPPCSCTSSCNPLTPQRTHQAGPNPSQPWVGRRGRPSSALWAQEGRFSFRGVKLQIPPPSPHPYNGSFLLPVTCWCRVLNFSIS